VFTLNQSFSYIYVGGKIYILYAIQLSGRAYNVTFPAYGLYSLRRHLGSIFPEAQPKMGVITYLMEGITERFVCTQLDIKVFVLIFG
jgi:hypothetical protein